MPPQRQLLLALGTLVILGFVFASVYFVYLRQPDAVLFANLRPMDAATIVAELDKRKIPYHLADGGTRILVAQDKVDATRLSILSQDLPLKGAVGFELFNKSDIGLTEFAQKINYQRALQGELARTIMALDAVDTARVHLSLPEETIFRDDKRAPKASIALTLKPGKALSSGAVLGIQRLVAAAVPELDVADVVVVDGEGQVISAESRVEQAASESLTQLAVEIYYADKVRKALAVTYPSQHMTVKVTATPTFTAQVVTEEADEMGDTPTASDDPFSQWTPEQRNFPLKVDVVGANARDKEAEQNIRVAVAAAIGANPALGDEISVISPDMVIAEPSVGNNAGNSIVASASQSATESQAAKFPWPAFWIVILVIAAIGMAFSGGQLLRVRRAPRKLTEAERRDFANRFQALLNGGEGDARF